MKRWIEVQVRLHFLSEVNYSIPCSYDTCPNYGPLGHTYLVKIQTYYNPFEMIMP